MESSGDLTLVLVGDTNLQHRVDPVTAFEHILPLLRAADVRFANLEGPLSAPSPDPLVPDIPHKQGWKHSDPRMVEGLVAAGFEAVGCANNVTYPPRAMLESLAELDRAGILHCGGGRNREEAHLPAVIERRGVRLGFLAYTSVFWPVGHAAGTESPGVATIKAHTAYQPHPRIAEMPGGPPSVVTWPDEAELGTMVEDIRRLREQVDVLAVSCHWGISGSTQTADYQRAIGRAAVEAGADVVIGHGPHLVQGIEAVRGPRGARPVFYSLGNFAFDWTKMLGRSLDGLLVRCAIRDRRLAEVVFVPVRRDEKNNVRPVAPDSSAGREIFDQVRGLSAPYATELLAGDEAVRVKF
jgi:hypothetical protein